MLTNYEAILSQVKVYKSMKLIVFTYLVHITHCNFLLAFYNASLGVNRFFRPTFPIYSIRPAESTSSECVLKPLNELTLHLFLIWLNI